MRAVFFLLVLANLVLFVWAQGYLGGRQDGREPQRLKDQIEPEKMKVVPQSAAPAAAQACRRVEGLAAKEAEQLQQAIQGSGAGLAASILPVAEETPNLWVNIPALPNKAAADKKAGELRLFGVTDFHVMQAEGGGFVISLGLFKDESSANEFLQEINRKGVKSARIDANAKPPALLRLEVRGAAEALAKRLPELLAGTGKATASDCP